MDDERSQRIESKLDHVVDKISEINVTLAKQSVILDEHVKRTNLLEEEVKPLKKDRDMMKGAMKLIALIATILGMAAAITELMK